MSDNLFQTGIRPAVDAYLKKKSEEERDYGDYWSASSAGYCMRLVIMRRLGVPKVPELEDNAAQTRIFESGKIFHEWMQRITKAAGLSIASEVELQDEDLMIRGHFDDLVLVPETDKWQSKETQLKAISVDEKTSPRTSTTPPISSSQHLILYDYKTAHSASFNYSKNRPMGRYHTYQVGTYLYMLHTFAKWHEDIWASYGVDVRDTKEGRTMAISKDDLRMQEKQLIWSDQLEKDIVDYWTTLNKYWEEKKMPPCTCLEHDGGFMGRRSAKSKVYNDFFWEDEPCSLKWYEKCKAEGKLKEAV